VPYGTAYCFKRIDAFRGLRLRQIRRKRVKLVAFLGQRLEVRRLRFSARERSLGLASRFSSCNSRPGPFPDCLGYNAGARARFLEARPRGGSSVRPKISLAAQQPWARSLRSDITHRTHLDVEAGTASESALFAREGAARKGLGSLCDAAPHAGFRGRSCCVAAECPADSQPGGRLSGYRPCGETRSPRQMHMLNLSRIFRSLVAATSRVRVTL
jgi:hypothetical protein